MPIYQFSPEKERITSYATLLEAQETTQIDCALIVSSIVRKVLCESKWYFSRSPFLDELYGAPKEMRRVHKKGETDKGIKNVRHYLHISHETNERMEKVMERGEDKGVFLRKALLSYIEKLENEKQTK